MQTAREIVSPLAFFLYLLNMFLPYFIICCKLIKKGTDAKIQIIIEKGKINIKIYNSLN